MYIFIFGICRIPPKYMLMLLKLFAQLLDMLRQGQLQKYPARGSIDYFYIDFLFWLRYHLSLIFFGSVCCHSFIGRLFRHALEDSRPKSVLVNLLSVCISLLDPKRLTSGTYYMYTRQTTHGSGSSANPETVQGMLESLGKMDFIVRLLLDFNDARVHLSWLNQPGLLGSRYFGLSIGRIYSPLVFSTDLSWLLSSN